MQRRQTQQAAAAAAWLNILFPIQQRQRLPTFGRSRNILQTKHSRTYIWQENEKFKVYLLSSAVSFYIILKFVVVQFLWHFLTISKHFSRNQLILANFQNITCFTPKPKPVNQRWKMCPKLKYCMHLDRLSCCRLQRQCLLVCLAHCTRRTRGPPSAGTCIHVYSVPGWHDYLLCLEANS